VWQNHVQKTRAVDAADSGHLNFGRCGWPGNSCKRFGSDWLDARNRLGRGFDDLIFTDYAQKTVGEWGQWGVLILAIDGLNGYFSQDRNAG
jgi:hypothetical protein